MSAGDDLEFANNVRAALEARPPRAAWVLVLTVLTALVAGIAWSAFAIVDEVTRGNGRVISSRQLQLVQSLDGGIIRAIFAQEGDLVESGAVLAELDDTGAASRLGELSQRRLALLAQARRLRAEAEGATSIPGIDDLQAVPGALANELAVFEAHRSSLSQELEVLRLQLAQKKQELDELKAGEAKLVGTLVPLTREIKLTRDLNVRGLVPEIELLKLERQILEMRGDLGVMRAARPRIETGILEIRQRIKNITTRFSSRARESFATTRADLAVIEESLKGAADRVRRSVLRAPVRGVINKFNVTTIGAVVQPGQLIAEIVPLDDTLLIEAKIRPQDVAFITPDQKAQIKLTAYDYRKYGSLDGQVTRISADTITEPNGETYYRVILKTQTSQIIKDEKSLPILPGMVATVDILTGTKSVLDYLLNPIARIRYEALRER